VDCSTFGQELSWDGDLQQTTFVAGFLAVGVVLAALYSNAPPITGNIFYYIVALGCVAAFGSGYFRHGITDRPPARHDHRGRAQRHG
jgi:hypothetical protein